MNWRLQLVLLFAKLRKPIDPKAGIDVKVLRKKSDAAAKLGSFLYDKKLPVKHITNINEIGIQLRIYNNSEEKNQRVMVYFHGGGFVLYDINSHDLVCRRLCVMNNCIVVSVNYRLAPEHSFPAAHNDAFAAIKWVLENIEKYGGSPANIVLAGDSAGGNLAACMAHRCKENGIAIRAQVLVYPWIDGRLSNPSIEKNGTGYLLEKETMFWFQEQYTPRAEDRCVPEVSPCFEPKFDGLAPAMVLTAEYDPLLDDGKNYHQQLKSVGIKSEYYEYKDLIHGFFNLPFVHKNALKAYTDIQQFLITV